MYTLLLLLFMQDDTTSATRESIGEIRQQLKEAKEELRLLRKRENQHEKDLAHAVELARRHAEDLRIEQEKRVLSANDNLQLLITGINAPLDRGAQIAVQYKCYTSPACIHCKPLFDDIMALSKEGYPIGVNGAFQVFTLTEQQWRDSGMTLPHVELWVDGVRSKEVPRPFSARTLADEYDTLKRDRTLGMNVGTLTGKTQVESLLTALQPFLNDGKLQIIYTPKPGVIRDFLTIQSGSAAIRIPARTAITLTMNNRELAGAFDSPLPQVRIPIRGNVNIKSMTLSGSRFAVQLPWMIDPEWTITDGPSPANFAP